MKNQVITFGCRLNSYESEMIRRNLDQSELDNVIVFNTCAVTKEAERQSKQAIRKAKRQFPHNKIIVTGCAAQIDPKRYAMMPEVDAVLGNIEKTQADTYRLQLFSQDEPTILVNDITSVKETAGHFVTGLTGKARAFLQVQNGCDHRCTFCIIPYGRGNSRSVPIGEIVRQVKCMVESGYQEIVLTGVDITAYGTDLPGQPTLGDMIRRMLHLVPELPRLRLSSLDVAEIDQPLIDLIVTEPRLMPHIHISLQAGDDMVLKRMKRRHSRQDVIDFCQNIRKKRPEIAFGADIIAGFPTEDETMFRNTLHLITEADLQYLHVFPYSPREGTPAAKMPQVPKRLRTQRAKILRLAGEKQLQQFLRRKIGLIEQVLVETPYTARAEDFTLLQLTNPKSVGTVSSVKISKVEGSQVWGE